MKREDVLKAIYDEISKNLKVTNLKPGDKLIDLGGNSRVVLGMIANLETKLNVKIKDFVVNHNPTLDMLATHITGLRV